MADALDSSLSQATHALAPRPELEGKLRQWAAQARERHAQKHRRALLYNLARTVCGGRTKSSTISAGILACGSFPEREAPEMGGEWSERSSIFAGREQELFDATAV